MQSQSMDFVNPRFDTVVLDDDALTSLILEMELDKINVLPELQFENFDLTDCSILTINREREN